jgi:hypothetical protein
LFRFCEKVDVLRPRAWVDELLTWILQCWVTFLLPSNPIGLATIATDSDMVWLLRESKSNLPALSSLLLKVLGPNGQSRAALAFIFAVIPAQFR